MFEWVRGTPARRQWYRRLALNALLPGFSVAMAVLALRALNLGDSEGGVWLDLRGWFVTGLIVCALLGFTCMFEKRTRAVGIFALAVALLMNPFSFALALGILGLG